jgi:hypothetical protein
MDDTSRRVEELRSDIEETRDEMSETIGAIQDKLRPSHIVAQATDRVKQATMEGVRDMTQSATDTARDAMSSRAIPLAMIGLGAAWLLMERTADSRSESHSWPRRDRPFRYQWEREETAHWRNTSAGHQYSTAADDFGVSAESMAAIRGGGERTGMMSRNAMAGRWQESDSGVNRIQHTARVTGNRIERMVRDNPLLVGAGALMLGAAFGMAVPETDVENEWMGDSRDSLMQSAQQMAHDAAAKVQDTAGSLADAAGRIATGGEA